MRVSGTVDLPARLDEFQFGRGQVSFESSVRRERTVVNIASDRTYSVSLRVGDRYRVEIRSLFLSYAGHRLFSNGSDLLTVHPGSILVENVSPPRSYPLKLQLESQKFTFALSAEARNGLPIAGATVLLTYVDSKGKYTLPYGVARTDLKGRAFFRGLPRGNARATLLSTGPFGLIDRRGPSRRYANLVVGRTDDARVRFEMQAAGVLDVTVDPRGRREPPPVALWRTDGTLAFGPVRSPTVRGTSPLYRFESVLPGHYRVVATYDDGKTLFREVKVRAGRVTPLLLVASRAQPTRFELAMRWKSFGSGARRTRLAFTPLRSGAATTIFEAVRGRPFRKTYGPGISAGRALVRYPGLGVARILTPNPRSNWILDVTPPRPGFLARGQHTVTVRVMRDGKPLRDLFVGLRQQEHARDARRTTWMRYGGTTAKGCVFRDVSEGWYEIRILDRVLGEEHRVRARVRSVRVHKKDVVLDWSIDGDR